MGNDKGKGGGAVVEDLMRYDLLVESALKHVVRMALARVQREGLPGEHHFYIAFDTRHPELVISSRLKEKYPEEMTIVLQHQFWDLKVLPEAFEVGLSFGGVPEKLRVPFAAVTGFYDPHVQFALQFRQPTEEEQALIGEVDVQAPAASKGERPATDSGRALAAESEAEQDKTSTDEKVVSLDAFRKKT